MIQAHHELFKQAHNLHEISGKCSSPFDILGPYLHNMGHICSLLKCERAGRGDQDSSRPVFLGLSSNKPEPISKTIHMKNDVRAVLR